MGGRKDCVRGKGDVQGRRAVDRGGGVAQERCALRVTVIGCKREFGLEEAVKGRKEGEDTESESEEKQQEAREAKRERKE